MCGKPLPENNEILSFCDLKCKKEWADTRSPKTIIERRKMNTVDFYDRLEVMIDNAKKKRSMMYAENLQEFNRIAL
jgi:hypothetical protein